jgi:hypothetical protein
MLYGVIAASQSIRRKASRDWLRTPNAPAPVHGACVVYDALCEPRELLFTSTYRVRSKEEIQPEWFEGVHSVAILGGILVPQWSIEEAAQHVRALCS